MRSLFQIPRICCDNKRDSKVYFLELHKCALFSKSIGGKNKTVIIQIQSANLAYLLRIANCVIICLTSRSFDGYKHFSFDLFSAKILTNHFNDGKLSEDI